MSQIVAGFRHSALTHEPEQLTTREIWAVAHQVRNQLLDNTLDRQIDLSRIEDKAARFGIQSITFLATTGGVIECGTVHFFKSFLAK